MNTNERNERLTPDSVLRTESYYRRAYAPADSGAGDAWRFHLACPLCGGATTHQSDVEVFIRADSQEKVARTVVSVAAKAAKVDEVRNEQSGNPSPRRDGLRILVCCEGGGHFFWLRVYQHKGATLLDCLPARTDEVTNFTLVRPSRW